VVKKGELYLAAKIRLETIVKQNNKELYLSWKGELITLNSETDGEHIGHLKL
jgi:hypothetical protein